MNTDIKSEMDTVFGIILKQYRRRSGYTQSEISEKLGISEKYVSRIETGMGGISKETLTKYMNLLEISPNIMFKDFITNPKIQAEIEISEQMHELSQEKLQIVLGMVKLLKNLK
jgi:transcriptional regulator with XRE-family HTH domain